MTKGAGIVQIRVRPDLNRRERREQRILTVVAKILQIKALQA
jgi:hypothetical protein